MGDNMFSTSSTVPHGTAGILIQRHVPLERYKGIAADYVPPKTNPVAPPMPHKVGKCMDYITNDALNSWVGQDDIFLHDEI